MDHFHDGKKMTSCVEKLYLDLMYCRADASNYNCSYVEYLLNLACEEMQKLADADERSIRLQMGWNPLQIYPEMK